MGMVHYIQDAPISEVGNVESEAALLGAVMCENALFDYVVDVVRPDDFIEPFHGRLFALIEDVIATGQRATPVTLRSRVAADPAIEKLGGPGYLAQLTGSGAGMVGISDFARQIADLAARRRLSVELHGVIAAANDMTVDGHKSIEDIVLAADEAIVAATQRQAESRAITLGRGVSAALDRIEAVQAGNAALGAMTGLVDLDDMVHGFAPSELIIVAGRPGMGKTALAAALTNGLARAGHGVLFFSQEMDRVSLSARMLADASYVSHDRRVQFDKIAHAKATREELDYLRLVEKHMATWPVEIDDRASVSVAQVVMAARRAKRRFEAKGKKLEVIIIDYMQLMTPRDRRMLKYEQISQISMDLRAAAKNLGLAIVALCQLSRAVEQREDKRPNLSDLRDSGQIEQDAHKVVFLYREEYYLNLQTPKPGNEEQHQERIDRCRGRMELICAKNRDGETGKATVQYLQPYQAVRSLDWGRSG